MVQCQIFFVFYGILYSVATITSPNIETFMDDTQTNTNPESTEETPVASPDAGQTPEAPATPEEGQA